MKYRLLAVDLDGTLLNSDGVLTEKTIDSVRRLIDSGAVFTVSTGRSLQGVEGILNTIGVGGDMPVITYNGAMIIMYKSKRILFESALSLDDSMDIIKLGSRYGTNIMVWSKNILYSSRLNEEAYTYSAISGVTPRLLPQSTAELLELLKDGATKILWYDDTEKITGYLNEVGDHLKDSVNFHTSQPYFLEFVDSSSSKAKAMEKLTSLINIKREEMVAVGDGLNDLSMIEYAGLGIAMENGHGKVKERANEVTLSNDEDGVSAVIEKYFFGDV